MKIGDEIKIDGKEKKAIQHLADELHGHQYGMAFHSQKSVAAGERLLKTIEEVYPDVDTDKYTFGINKDLIVRCNGFA